MILLTHLSHTLLEIFYNIMMENIENEIIQNTILLQRMGKNIYFTKSLLLMKSLVGIKYIITIELFVSNNDKCLEIGISVVVALVSVL